MMSTTAIDRDRHRAEQPRHQRQRHRNRAEPNPRRPAYRFYTNPGTLPEGIRRVPHAALCTARLRPTRTRRAAGSQWVARPAVLSTARYAADWLRNVGLPNRQKPQGMSCEAMGEFRVSAPRGGLRTASIYAFLGWDLMRPGFPPFDGRVPAFSERWNQIYSIEPFGWTGRRAKWIALACLHSGVFTRAQWTRFLGCHTEKVRRAVHALIAQGVAAEENVPGITGISRVCRIYGRGIYTGRTRANRRVEGTGSQASWPGADSPRHHLADRAPLRSALPMTDLRLMPPLGCENDVGGRFTVCPVPNSHGTRRVSAEAAVSYASAARPAVARRAAQAEMGATPQSEGLVRVRTQVCFYTPAPVPWGRSHPSIPTREGGLSAASRRRVTRSPTGRPSGNRASPSKAGVPPMARATAQAAKSGTRPSQVTDGLPARDCWMGATSRRRVDGRAHPTLPDAVPGIPKGGSLPPRPHPPERHRRSSGCGATATQPATCGTAGAHMEAAFSCTCTPMSMCARGTPPTPGDRRSKSTSRKSARTPSRIAIDHRSGAGTGARTRRVPAGSARVPFGLRRSAKLAKT